MARIEDLQANEISDADLDGVAGGAGSTRPLGLGQTMSGGGPHELGPVVSCPAAVPPHDAHASPTQTGINNINHELGSNNPISKDITNIVADLTKAGSGHQDDHKLITSHNNPNTNPASDIDINLIKHQIDNANKSSTSDLQAAKNQEDKAPRDPSADPSNIVKTVDRWIEDMKDSQDQGMAALKRA